MPAGAISAIVVLLGGFFLLLQGGYLSGATGSFGGNLTAQQISQLAASAGFTGDDLATAVAIALAESSGNPNAYDPETAAKTPSGQGSYGLWQIYLKDHQEYAGSNLYDPQTNANAAFAIFSASGFNAWSTYKDGAYQTHLNAARSVTA